jgi:autotransporter-associated beta strand protein
VIGFSGTGDFQQTAGTNSISSGLTLGGRATGKGTYELSGGKLLVSDEYIGSNGEGIFTQTGGTHTISGNSAGILDIGYVTGSKGTYILSGTGALTAFNENIGYFSTGLFQQSGGTNTATHALSLGYEKNGNGTYQLSGGTLSVAWEYVGDKGTGLFQQTGGTHTVSQTLRIGSSTNSTGTYELSGTGKLSAQYEDIGDQGNGSFKQSGGTHTVTNDLYLSHYSGSSGTYLLSGGTLSAKNEYLGYANSGTFTQSGGTHTVNNNLYIGYNAGVTGTYELSGTGVLSATYETLGFYGNGVFNQTGGTNKTSSLMLGNTTTATSTYNLSGSGVINATSETIGNYGYHVFNQSGGTNNVTHGFTVGGWTSGTGIYNLTSGSLSASTEIVGSYGNGVFNQTGGTNSIPGTYFLTSGLVLGQYAGSKGTYNLEGGTLILKALSQGAGSANFNFGGGTLQACGDLATTLPMTLTGQGGNAVVNTAGYNVTLGGVLSGDFTTNVGGLVKNGNGTLTLSGDNTYTGGTTLNAGTLKIGNNSALGRGGLTVNSGTVDLNAYSITLTSLSGNGGRITDNSTGVGTTTLTLENNATSTFGGVIQNGTQKTVALVKNGQGMLVLSGENTYTGGTTVNAGNLKVTGSLASAVAVNDGATLSGNGSVGSVLLNAGSTLSPGGSIGTLTVNGNLTLLSGSTLQYELESPDHSDLTIVTGTLTVDGVLDLSDFDFLYNADDLSAGVYTLLTANEIDAILGRYITEHFGSLWGTLSLSDNTVILTLTTAASVPEPGTLAIWAAGMMGFAFIRRRQRANREKRAL